MSRPQAFAGTRFGFEESPRTSKDLLDAGLVTDDGRLTPDAEAVLAALAKAGRPDLALQQLGRLMQGAVDAPELGRRLRADRRFAARLIGLLGGSTVLGDHLVAFAEDWALLADDGPLPDLAASRAALDRAARGDAGADVLTGPEATAALRRAYRGRLMIIAAADLAPAIDPALPPADLTDVCAALSDLADATIGAALAVARATLSATVRPVRLGVVAMGKCGARELNYLSDVDVIFVAAPSDGEGDTGDEPAALAAATALAAEMMRICGQVAWEVDAGLRPEGRAGPLVRTLSSHRAYYGRWAHTWEFQALLKARPAAGDLELAREFCEMTAPLVWSAAGRESFVDDVQAMRRRVESHIPAAQRDLELKLGAGGLRDVEFAVQLLQLVHGRTDPALRRRGTLEALRALTDGGYVGRTDGAEMSGAYTFLRRAEHRLQLQRLRRTHLLPTDHADLEWLARTDGISAHGTADAAEVFATQRRMHAATVRRLHEKLFYRPLLHAVAAVGDGELALSEEAAADRFAALGFRNPSAALAHLAALTAGVSRRAAIQRALLPVLLDTFAAAPDPDAGLLAYRQVSEALAETPWYLRLLRDEGLVAQRLASLLGESRLVPDLLVRAPEVLRLLTSDEALLRPRPDQVAGALLARSARARDAKAAVQAVRSARRHEILRLACADLLGLVGVEEVGAALTTLTDACVQAALAAAERAVHGERGGLTCRVAVIGLGRFGGGEMGYGSDADVMFVADTLPGGSTEQALSDAIAVAETMTRLLGAPSPDPPLLLDAGLRPEGRNGPMARSLDSYTAYWERFADPWERQALLRARPVAGDTDLGQRFVQAAEPVRYPADGLTRSEVTEIRRIKARVDAERLPRGVDPNLHTKLGPGGLADIEWTVQLLQLRHAGRHLGLRTPGTLPALAAAADADLMATEDAEALAAGWRMATRVRNALMLVGGRPADVLPRHGRELTAVARALGYPPGQDPGVFVDDYRRAARRARRVVDRLFDGD